VESISTYARDLASNGLLQSLIRFASPVHAKSTPAPFGVDLKSFFSDTLGSILPGTFNTIINVLDFANLSLKPSFSCFELLS